MGTWQMVATAWRTTTAGLSIVGVVAGINLVLGLIALPFIAAPGETVSGPQAAIGLLLALTQFLLLPLIQGGCLSFAAGRLQAAGGAALAGFWPGAKRLYKRLLGFEAVTVGLLVSLAFVSILLFGISMIPNLGPDAVRVVLALLVALPVALGLYLVLLILTMGPVAIAVGGAGVFEAVKRGLAVGRAAVGKLILVTLALLLTLIPVFVVTSLPDWLGGPAAGLPWVILSLVLQSGAGAVSMLLFLTAYVQIFRAKA